MSTDYEKYRKRRRIWDECLYSEDQHSVWQQVLGIAWDVAVYRIAMRAVELAPVAPEGGHELNGMILDLLNRSFHESQLVRIRRLTEFSGHGLDGGDRAVYSLAALLKDMEDHCELMTPENILRFEKGERVSDDWWIEQRRERLDRH